MITNLETECVPFLRVVCGRAGGAAEERSLGPWGECVAVCWPPRPRMCYFSNVTVLQKICCPKYEYDLTNRRLSDQERTWGGSGVKERLLNILCTSLDIWPGPVWKRRMGAGAANALVTSEGADRWECGKVTRQAGGWGGGLATRSKHPLHSTICDSHAGPDFHTPGCPYSIKICPILERICGLCLYFGIAMCNWNCSQIPPTPQHQSLLASHRGISKICGRCPGPLNSIWPGEGDRSHPGVAGAK